MLPIIQISKPFSEQPPPKTQFILQFDGCSKGNPGISGAGAVIYKDGNEIWSSSVFVGKKHTNNQAEYMGLIIGLEEAINRNITTLCVEGDSLLIINQMTGQYKCNSSSLLDYYVRAKGLEKQIDDIYFNHIYRTKNKRADQLSNIAVEKYIEL